jgi:protocatechuate 3,4-dioxygenase beta subunit
MKQPLRAGLEGLAVAALAAALAFAWSQGVLGPARPPGPRRAAGTAPGSPPASAPASRPASLPASQAASASAPVASALTGRVVDPQGRGVAGARVTVREVVRVAPGPRLVEEAGDLGVLTGPLPFPDELPEPAGTPPSAPTQTPGAPGTPGAPTVARAGAELASTETGPDGSFAFGGVVASQVVLEARHPAYACSEPQRLGLSPGTTVGEITLRLSAGTLVHGRVTDPFGAPLAGAVVAPILADSVGAQADAKGEYRLPSRCGEVALQATSPGYRRATVVLRLDPGERARVLDFKLARGGEVLRGRVLDPRDRPVAGARITLVEPGRRGGQTAMSGGGGEFAVAGLGPGPYRLEASHPDYPTVTLEDVGLGRDVTVRFGAGGGVSGLVRDETNAAPIARATVELRPRGGGDAITRRGARFEVRGLAPGAWVLGARAPGYVARTVDVEVPAADRAGEVTVRDLLVELTRGAVASGEVRDEHGDRVPGAEVRLGDRRTRAGARGEFRLEDLPPGDQVLRVRRTGYLDAEVPVTLRAGDETRGLDVRLPAAQ